MWVRCLVYIRKNKTEMLKTCPWSPRVAKTGLGWWIRQLEGLRLDHRKNFPASMHRTRRVVCPCECVLGPPRRESLALVGQQGQAAILFFVGGADGAPSLTPHAGEGTNHPFQAGPPLSLGLTSFQSRGGKTGGGPTLGSLADRWLRLSQFI